MLPPWAEDRDLHLRQDPDSSCRSRRRLWAAVRHAGLCLKKACDGDDEDEDVDDDAL